MPVAKPEAANHTHTTRSHQPRIHDQISPGVRLVPMETSTLQERQADLEKLRTLEHEMQMVYLLFRDLTTLLATQETQVQTVQDHVAQSARYAGACLETNRLGTSVCGAYPGTLRGVVCAYMAHAGMREATEHVQP